MKNARFSITKRIAARYHVIGIIVGVTLLFAGLGIAWFSEAPTASSKTSLLWLVTLIPIAFIAEHLIELGTGSASIRRPWIGKVIAFLIMWAYYILWMWRHAC